MRRGVLLGTASGFAALAGFLAGLLVTTELASASPSSRGDERSVLTAGSFVSPPGAHRHTSSDSAQKPGRTLRIPSTAAPRWAGLVPSSTTQVVRTVSSRFWCVQRWCTVTQAWRKVGGDWVLVKHFRSTIGSAGWGKRREGDMRSPSGVYRVKVTFSTGHRAPGRMPWKRRRPTSTVTAAHGRLYNTWIEERGRTDGDRPAMRYGFVVDYNRVRLRPYVGPRPVAGKGSGIFYHTSRPGRVWAPTEGCTQVGNVANMRWLVQWLRPGAQPRIVQNR